MAILVTGARGFVGQSIVGGDVVPFDGDIRDASSVRAIVGAVKPAGVIHLAAIASPRDAAKDAASAWDVNLIGTFNLAQAVLELVPEAPLVFASSSEVYGQTFADFSGASVPETAASKPLSRYGATKAAAEAMLLQMAREGLRVTCFRPFNHTGERQSESYVIPSFARQIARIEKGLQEPIIVTGNLDVVRDFLDVEDVVRAYLRVARGEVPQAAGEIVNLASGRPMRLREMLDYMLSQSQTDIKQAINPALVRRTDVEVIAGDISKAKALLAWEPRIPIEQTLNRVLEHWRSFVFK